MVVHRRTVAVGRIGLGPRRRIIKPKAIVPIRQVPIRLIIRPKAIRHKIRQGPK